MKTHEEFADELRAAFPGANVKIALANIWITRGQTGLYVYLDPTGHVAGDNGAACEVLGVYDPVGGWPNRAISIFSAFVVESHGKELVIDRHRHDVATSVAQLLSAIDGVRSLGEIAQRTAAHLMAQALGGECAAEVSQ